MRICSKKFISYLAITVILSLGLSLSFQSILALSGMPILPPFGDNINRSDVLVDEGDFDSLVNVEIPIGLMSNFQVGTDGLFVDHGNKRVSVNKLIPVTTLDIAGPLRIGRFSVVPLCNASLIGSMYYDENDQMPYVCTSGGWLYF